MNLSDELSRVRASMPVGGHSNWNLTQNSVFKVIGRHVFNVWRIMRGELNLLSYTFENITYHLLKQRSVSMDWCLRLKLRLTLPIAAYRTTPLPP